MNLNKNIFREYDIRGIYPSELNETVAYYVGLAYGTRLKEKGKDTTMANLCKICNPPRVINTIAKRPWAIPHTILFLFLGFKSPLEVNIPRT